MGLPRLGLTPGEPAGLGPDLAVSIARQPLPAEIIVFADPDLLARRARRLGRKVSLAEFDPARPVEPHQPGVLKVAPVRLRAPVIPGQLDPANAPYVLATLERAVAACQAGRVSALVTGPVHKGIINDAGVPFSGHTEFLQERTGSGQVVMMLATEGLRVALATTHLPLARVPAAITQAGLESVIRVLEGGLREFFGLPAPRIAVLGLNPHAGEGGYLGREELETIQPVVDRLRAEGMQLEGPLPADTAFTPAHLECNDAVLAMYHDQGLPVLKYLGFGRAVNITLGLPIIRTSVDHGTALDLAGTGRGDCGSLVAAIEAACEMVRHRHD